MRRFLGLLPTLAFVLAACGSQSSNDASRGAQMPLLYATPSTKCSEAPRWPRGTKFEYERGGPTDAPACTPHCGPNEKASAMWRQDALTSEALPSGACEEEGVVCTMSAEWIGTCPPRQKPVGPLDVFICRCQSGQWACTVDGTAPSATPFSCTTP